MKTIYEDNFLIELKFVFDYESYRDYIRFLITKGRWYKVFPILMYIIFPILSLQTLILGIITQNSVNIMLFVLFIIVILLYSFMYFYFPKISYQKSKSTIADEIIYKFYENHLEGNSISENFKSFASYQYDDFRKVYEVHSAFYLMLMNHSAFIVPKRCLDAGQLYMLSNFFMYRFGEKYKNCH